MEAEKRLRNEILILEGQIKDLQATQKIAEQQRLLEIEKVKSDLETKLQSERAKAADLNRSVQDYLLEISKADVDKLVRDAKEQRTPGARNQ